MIRNNIQQCADYKEFSTPQMLLWKTCYAKVEKALNKLLAD
jgi:hypothetical protein